MIRIVLGLCLIMTCIDGFTTIHPHCRLQPAVVSMAAKRASSSRLELQQHNNKDDESFQEKLDTLFFDPDQVLKDNEDGQVQNPIAIWFANLMKNDYEIAESFFAAAFISTMVVLSQELLRMQLYGEHYIPFTKGSSPGSLF